jgi:hypothetical protein
MSDAGTVVRDRLRTDRYPRSAEITHTSVLRHDLLHQEPPTR